jgi:hypothetical protein
VPPGWAGISGNLRRERPSLKGSCGDCRASAGAPGEDPEDGYTLAGEMLEEMSSLLYLPPRRLSFAPRCIA